MLKKRDLPVVAPIPGIRFNLDKIKEELSKIEHLWEDIYKANPGITKLHDPSFVDNAYANLKEIPLMVMSPENMAKADDFELEDLGATLRDRIRNKNAQGDNLPPTATELLWDYQTDAC
jgi:hypothetical protein